MRRATSPLSLLAVLLVILAGPAMGGLSPATANAPAPVVEVAHAHAAESGSAHAAPREQRHGRDGASHHEGGSSCCVVGCALAVLLDGGTRLPGPAPARLVVRRAAESVPGRATSPPHRPPRLFA